MKSKLALIFLLLFATGHLKAHVSLKSPTGGETYSPGQTITISWQEVVAHNTINWDLFFSSDGGLSWDILQADISAGTLSYEWTIPDVQTSQAKIRIVQDNVDSDYSDDSGDFSISLMAGIETDSELKAWNIYPNPFKDFTTLSFENPSQKSFTLLLINTLGRTAKKIDGILSNQVIIEKGNLPEGLYFFQLSSGSEKYAFGRLIIE